MRLLIIILKKMDCPKCKNKMERRKRNKDMSIGAYYFTEWDYCIICGYLQHYEKYKVLTKKI